MTTASFYHRVGDDTFEPTANVQGAWRETEQHMGPASGLLAYALETAYPRDDRHLCRISYEILGVISAERLQIAVDVVRPGRRIELLEARMIINGRTAIRATGWRLAGSDTSAVAGGAPGPLPPPQAWPTWEVGDIWAGGYIESLEFRADPESVPGRCRAWLRTSVTLLEDEPVSDLVAFTTLVDTANGIGARQHPTRWMFPNLDLTIHYFRTPAFTDSGDRWIGLDTTAVWGAGGIGVTSSALYDGSGAVGRAEQLLMVRKL